MTSLSPESRPSEERGRPPRITPAEWAFVALAVAAVLAVTSVPVWYAYATTPADRQFMGIMLNVPDHVQYFSWLRQFFTQDLARNTLTPEPNQPVFFNLLWWLLARLGNLTGWEYPALFQVLRVAATAAFLPILYLVSAWFLAAPAQRRAAFLVALLGGGFGWVLVAIKYAAGLADPPFPLLVYIVEPNTFFGLLTTPHLIGGALYILAFDLIRRAEVTGQRRYAVAAGLWTLFLGWQHTYDLWLVFGILGVYGLLRVARDRRLPWFLASCGLILGALSVWPALYSLLLTSLDPVWSGVLAQFDNAGVFTPSLWQLPILLGPAFLLAVAVEVRRNPFRLAGLSDDELFLRAWFWGNLALAYLPTDYQIKMLNGWQAPAALLAVHGLAAYGAPLLRRWRPAWSEAAARRVLAAGLLVLVLPTNLYLYAWRFLDLGRHDYPYYLHRDEVAALEWLRPRIQTGDVVMASLTLGQYVPALTGAQAVLAHWAQTLDYYSKIAAVEEFYAADTSATRQAALLDEFQVAYVIYGPAEQALGGSAPEALTRLRLVHTSGQVRVYQVQP